MWFRLVALIIVLTASLKAEESLLDAVYHDRTDDAMRLIAAADKETINQKNRYGVSALVLACKNGNAKLVNRLIKAGADPNTTSASGESALMIAARTGVIDSVKHLLAAGAKADATDRKNQCALMWAAAEGYTDVGQVLIDAGVDPSRVVKGSAGFSALFFAARAGRTDFVKMLNENGANLLQKTTATIKNKRLLQKGTTALRLAVENGHFETAVYLLDHGANANGLSSGYAPLHVLTWVRKPHRGDNHEGMPPPSGSGTITSLQFARLLVEKYDADVNLQLKSGSSGGPHFGNKAASPFLLASRRADLPYLKLLHELGAKLSLANADGTNPLLAVSGVGSIVPEEEAGTETEAIAVLNWLWPLLNDPKAINTKNKNGETAMHGAAYRNWPTLANRLDQLGADPSVWNQKNKHDWTPLAIAQGYRKGNFKPSAATIAGIQSIMQSHGVEIPKPLPPRSDQAY